MAKAKQGDLLSCVECGLVVVVDEVCGCADAAIVCCEQPMAKGKLAAAKARKKATAKVIPVNAAKTVKAAGPAKAKAGNAKAGNAKAGNAKAKAVAPKAVAKAAVKAPAKAPAKPAPKAPVAPEPKAPAKPAAKKAAKAPKK